MNTSFKKKLVKSKLKWAGHVEEREINNWLRGQLPRKWMGKGAR